MDNFNIEKRNFLYSFGNSDAEQRLPLVGIICEDGSNTYINEVIHGVKQGGAACVVIPLPSLYNSRFNNESKGACLPFRESTAHLVECLIGSYNLSGVVLIAHSETVAAGMILGAISKNTPLVFLPSLMQDFSYFDLEGLRARVKCGKAGIGELENYPAMQKGQTLYHSDCCLYKRTVDLDIFNSLCLFLESSGAILCGSAFVTSASEGIEACSAAGKEAAYRALNLICPRHMFSLECIKNALCVTLACGGSVGAVLHILAIATQTNACLSYKDLEKLSPPIVYSLSPFSDLTLVDFEKAGGVKMVYKTLAHSTKLIKQEFIPKSIAKSLDEVRAKDISLTEVGGVNILSGNIAVSAVCQGKNQGVVKQSVRVFDSEALLEGAILGKGLKNGDVIVLKNCGVGHGYPLIAIDCLLKAMELNDITIITEGRCLEGGACNYISQLLQDEAFDVILDGDMIEIDYKKGKLNLSLPAKELSLRIKRYRKEPLDNAFLLRYSQLALPPENGCIFKSKF